jgi:ornithine cyclodeaminase/alanine dehydrogenase-like protein (mu-crystallin family)
VLVLEDADVQRLLQPTAAIAAVRESLIAHHTGGLTAPPRLHAPLGDGAGQCRARRAGAGQRRETSDQITLFCSVGLAGTEVAVAAGLLRADR